MRLIDADDAIEAISSMFAPTPTQKDMVEDCLEIIENLPSAQPERAIKDCRNCKHGNYNDHWDTYFCYHSDDCNDWDKWEPSEETKPKKGKWILKKELVPLPWNSGPLDWNNYDIKTHSEWKEYYHCSNCEWKSEEFKCGNFCPCCGADMKGEHDE